MARAEDVARSVATLDERLNGIRREIDTITAKSGKSDDAVNAIDRRLTLLESGVVQSRVTLGGKASRSSRGRVVGHNS